MRAHARRLSATVCQPTFCRGQTDRRPASRGLGIMLAGVLLSACGQRGPLYLPPDNKPASSSLTIEQSVQTTAPDQSRSKDDKPVTSDTPVQTGNN